MHGNRAIHAMLFASQQGRFHIPHTCLILECVTCACLIVVSLYSVRWYEYNKCDMKYGWHLAWLEPANAPVLVLKLGVRDQRRRVQDVRRFDSLVLPVVSESFGVMAPWKVLHTINVAVFAPVSNSHLPDCRDTVYSSSF
jgi:hypothetical protein